MHMQSMGGQLTFGLDNVVTSPLLSPGGTPPSFGRMGTGLPTGAPFSLDYGYATSPVEGHFGMGPTMGL